MLFRSDFGKELSADLLVSKARKKVPLLGKRRKNKVESENAEFNKEFSIYSDSAHDAFYVLTPHMMEYIMEMNKKSQGNSYLRFQKDGKVHIAIDSGRDSFELGSVKKINVQELREQFIEEIRYITDLIDELRLVDTLYLRL